MKMSYGKQMLLLGLALVAFSGCTTYPVAKNLRQQARPVALAQAVANPRASQGTVVIWGGRIIKTTNDANGGDLYVLKLPLARNEKPVIDADSSGRFIARSRGFLDPEIYQRGRLVTVAGSIAGLESHLVQKTNYAYPVVAIKQVHVWPVERREYYYYPYYPGWGGYYPGWFWGWGLNWNFHGGDWGRGYHGGHWERVQPDGHWGGHH